MPKFYQITSFFRERPNWQGPGPIYVENMRHKIVVRRKNKSKRGRSRSRSPCKAQKEVARNLGSEATMAYIRMVKTTFINYPEVYNAFVRILSEIKEPYANIIEIIEKVVLLFDGYPDLIFSFNSFLPHKYEIEIQDDAVVIRVYDSEDQGGIMQNGTPTVEFTGSMAYIRQVKKTYAYVPEKYGKFMEILDKFHSKKLDEIRAIRKVVQLFQGHPNLILGFNQFLPEGYKIHMYNKSSCIIEHPGKNGKPDRTTVEV